MVSLQNPRPLEDVFVSCTAALNVVERVIREADGGVVASVNVSSR